MAKVYALKPSPSREPADHCACGIPVAVWRGVCGDCAREADAVVHAECDEITCRWCGRERGPRGPCEHCDSPAEMPREVAR